MINLWASRRDLFKYFKAQMQSDNKPKPVSRPQHVKDDKLGEYGFDEYNKMGKYLQWVTYQFMLTICTCSGAIWIYQFL
jgi:hypothetical protein